MTEKFNINEQSCPSCGLTMKFVRTKVDDHGMIQEFLQCTDMECIVVAVSIIRKKD